MPVIISYKFYNHLPAKNRRGRIRRGYCSICGSKLTNQKSIDLGIGAGCRRKTVAIVFNIIPEKGVPNA
jgi:hypothetical protein